MSVFSHKPVLLDECIQGLAIKKDGIYVDGTLGGGGHSTEIIKNLDKGFVVGIDRDADAVTNAIELFKSGQSKIKIVQAVFSEIPAVLAKLEIKTINGALLDLGVSSYQLDNPERGFSYMQDGPLDMRMDQNSELSAEIIINNYSEAELKKIITYYGEERWAARIAEFIVMERPLHTTFELVSCIKRAVPKGARQEGIHPAKRTFQAIRIEVNSELSILEKTLEDIVSVMAEGGRLCVITFHSLEDRIVKTVFKKLERPCTCPLDCPICICGKQPVLKLISRKPVLPTENEIMSNPRARSAKLRIAEKI